MIKKIAHFFDVLEDKVRGHLSRYPLIYACVGGIGVVLFWRGVWHVADDMGMSSIASFVIGSIILLITGVFVSAFVGSRLIISGLKGEKKLVEKTEEEIKSEESEIKHIERDLDTIEKEIKEIKTAVQKDHNQPRINH